MRVLRTILASALALCCGTSTEPLRADEPANKPWRETWIGGDISPHVWLVYSGTTIAPFADIWSDGFRLRMASGYGQYGVRYGKTDYDVSTYFADALIGYQMRFGTLTAKLFAGAAYIGVDAVSKARTRALSEPELGAKAVLELWLDIADRSWASLDAAYTTAHDSFSVRARYGYRITPPFSFGHEIILNGNDLWIDRRTTGTASALERALHNDIRFGSFLRFQWTGGEVSVSGGISGDIDRPIVPYATINASFQY